jgi:hypothetical protein
LGHFLFVWVPSRLINVEIEGRTARHSKLKAKLPHMHQETSGRFFSIFLPSNRAIDDNGENKKYIGGH